MRPLSRRLAKLERHQDGVVRLGDDWPIEDQRGLVVPANFINDILNAIDGRSRALPVQNAWLAETPDPGGEE